MAKVVIVGGGVAGLSAGIYLQKQGHQAIICEKSKTAGGNLTGWQRGEYHLDNCIHWLTGTNKNSGYYKMWTDLGALGEGVDIYQPPELYSCREGKDKMALYADLERVEREMLALSPPDKRQISRFIRAVKAVQGIEGIAGKNADEKAGFLSLLKDGPLLLSYHCMSTKRFSEKFRHPLLRRFFRSLLGDDFSALCLVCVFSAFCGQNGALPKGGSLAMAQRMAKRFTDVGGTLLLGKEVVKIHTEKGVARAVSFADESELEADYVVVTAEPTAVFGKILDADMPPRLRKMYADERYVRFSDFHCAFACDEAELPFSGDRIVYVPDEYFGVLHTRNLILREFSHEPSFAPAGKNVLQTMIFCNENDARYFIGLSEDKEKYEAYKRKLAEAVGKIIEKEFPQLAGKLHLADMWTPATYRRFTNAETGSYMAFVLPPRTLPVRVGCRIKGLSNVVLATQWQQAPGGLPNAADVGKKAAFFIAGEEEKKKAARRVKTLQPEG